MYTHVIKILKYVLNILPNIINIIVFADTPLIRFRLDADCFSPSINF